MSIALESLINEDNSDPLKTIQICRYLNESPEIGTEINDYELQRLIQILDHLKLNLTSDVEDIQLSGNTLSIILRTILQKLDSIPVQEIFSQITNIFQIVSTLGNNNLIMQHSLDTYIFNHFLGFLITKIDGDQSFKNSQTSEYISDIILALGDLANEKVLSGYINAFIVSELMQFITTENINLEIITNTILGLGYLNNENNNIKNEHFSLLGEFKPQTISELIRKLKEIKKLYAKENKELPNETIENTLLSCFYLAPQISDLTCVVAQNDFDEMLDFVQEFLNHGYMSAINYLSMQYIEDILVYDDTNTETELTNQENTNHLQHSS